VPLERGLNYIELRAIDPPAPTKGKNLRAPRAVSLENVRLVEP